MDSICVPFVVEQSFMHSKGQARLNADNVHIEFQNVDAFLKVFKSKVQEFSIPFSDIEFAEFKSAWMGLDNALRIKTRSMKTVQDFPGSEQSWITLSIERAHRELAAEFVSHLKLHVSELALKRLDGKVDVPPALNSPA